MRKNISIFLKLFIIAFALGACVSKPPQNHKEPEKEIDQEDYVFTYLDMHNISYPKEGENLKDALLLYHYMTFWTSGKVSKIEIKEKNGKEFVSTGRLVNYPQKNWLKRQLFGRRYVKDVEAPNFSLQEANELIAKTSNILNNGGHYELNENGKAVEHICLDGPTYFVIVRLDGKVKKGELNECAEPRIDELVCKIETGKPCQNRN